MLPHVQTLFGGNALPALDGDEHRERKAFVMAAFTREALAAYLPEMQRQVGAALARWAAQPEVRWLDEFKQLALEVICTTILGLQPGPALDQIARDYEIFGKGFSALPIALPGTTYKKATQALDRILAAYEKNVKEHLAAPGGAMDGLARILESRSPRDGRAISVDEAKRELHHIVVAGLIVLAWFVTAVVELDRNPAVRERLRAEVAALPAGRVDAGGVRRARRTCRRSRWRSAASAPSCTCSSARRARRSRSPATKSRAAGWSCSASGRPTCGAEVYADPEKFDPDRFAAPRSEQDRHPHAFVPNGAGDAHTGHKCAGYEYAPLLLNVFLVELLRSGAKWSFTPGQDLSLDYARIPPAPRDGLRARITLVVRAAARRQVERRIRRSWRWCTRCGSASSESGSVAVMMAICMTVFLGFAALGLDLAIGRYARMQLENATDAAAHAALVRLRATDSLAAASSHGDLRGCGEQGLGQEPDDPTFGHHVRRVGLSHHTFTRRPVATQRRAGRRRCAARPPVPTAPST